MVRNAGGNPGNTADDMTGRNVRRQTDDARYLNFQNEVIWKTGGPSAQHTLLGGIELTNTHVDTVRIDRNPLGDDGCTGYSSIESHNKNQLVRDGVVCSFKAMPVS